MGSEPGVLKSEVIDLVLLLSLLMVGLLYVVRHLFHQGFELPALVIDGLNLWAVVWSNGLDQADLLWFRGVPPNLLWLIIIVSDLGLRVIQVVPWGFAGQKVLLAVPGFLEGLLIINIMSFDPCDFPFGNEGS